MDDQTEILAFLAHPEPFGARGRVERIDTHISHVFLAGDRAYKLKRAVRYSYLDYSTVDLRRRFCLAELAVNRRFAPHLYLGLRPVLRADSDDGHLLLGPEWPAGEDEPPLPPGQVVDWLLVMRRFDQDALLDRMATQGRLTPQLMLDLADRLARLHRAQQGRADGGGAAGLEQAVAITRANLKPGDAFAAPDIRAWNAKVQAALAAQGPLLDARRDAGRVRDCHGDLHLGNVCLVDGTPTPFDAIEFDPDLARTDVLYDLAFLLMDLCFRDRADLASLVLNRYLDLTGEDLPGREGQALGGLPVLPLFLSVRAGVRAQVTAAAARRQTTPTQKTAGAVEAGRYLQLALDFLRRDRPRVVAVGGFSGTGKSTLAGALAPLLGAAPGARVLRSDVIRKQLFGLAPDQPLGPEAYTPTVNAAVYDRLRIQAAACLAAGRSVILDAVFANPEERALAAEVAAHARARFTGLWLQAPEDVLVERLRRRAQAPARDASDADIPVLLRQMGKGAGDVRWAILDAGPTPALVLRQAEALLRPPVAETRTGRPPAGRMISPSSGPGTSPGMR
ncbi:bifunctional aminoglycoside phosphotransferase/ATP-binding protein [Azospirillum sp. B4]|uniref:bifunctional aminoglycoside phosphotransferase/ATP-binding protein n=1 Tax=Azospirillum sp. B4 TaxID=95605 RepID=UPI000347F60C|nr:bifunctional aminoglycoside phosphotransferase/ATP-binding protein [Azospirillum sp. B4]